MKKSINILAALLFVLLPLFYFSCKKDKPLNEGMDFGYNYIPDGVGSYIIYQVDSISFDDITHKRDTTRYLLKEQIASFFFDNVGRKTLRIERCRKKYKKGVPYDSIPWSAPYVWIANKTSTDFQKVEENIRYIRLVFPLKNGVEWNANSYNTFPEKRYKVASLDKKEVINSIAFDSVLFVKQIEKVDFIQYRYEIEKYGRNIGLLYKERDSIYHGGTPDSIGYTFVQKIVSYGK
jgi:hypothetical protein